MGALIPENGYSPSLSGDRYPAEEAPKMVLNSKGVYIGAVRYPRLRASCDSNAKNQ